MSTGSSRMRLTHEKVGTKLEYNYFLANGPQLGQWRRLLWAIGLPVCCATGPQNGKPYTNWARPN